MTLASPPQPVPLRLGNAADFARVRAGLEQAGFDEAAICSGLRIQNLGQIGLVRPQTVAAFATQHPGLGALVRLLTLGEVVPRSDLERLVAADLRAAFTALDVVRPIQTAQVPDGLFAAVMLYPVAGLFIASDRHDNPDGSRFVAPADVVFPAIFHGTLRFLRIIARSPARDVLDLGSGTGIAALLLSRTVGTAVASDLTARSTHFAAFNRLLNDCANVEVVQGDLYEPVAGRQFDRIVAHPPYVPALSDTQIFRDAGDTGESIVQRIIADLPRYLRPGGTCYCVAAGWDAAGQPLEQRIRAWLGPASGEFDVILAHDEEISPDAVAQRLSDKLLGGDTAAGARERFERQFASAALEKNVYCAMVLHRVAPGAKGGRVTRRVRRSERTDGASLEAALAWLRWRAEREAAGDLESAVLGATLRLGADLNVKTLHVVEDGRLVQGSIVLESDRPFLSSTKVEPWMAGLIAAFAGGHKAADVYERARREKAVPEGFAAGDFVTLLVAMVERGYLALEGVA